MKKIGLCLLFVTVFIGCAVNRVGLQKDDLTVTKLDAKKFHNYGWMGKYYNRRIELTDEQIKKVERFGVELTPSDKFIDYVKVTRRKSGGRSKGKVFSLQGEGEFGAYKLLICIHKGLIAEIHVENNPTDKQGNKIINKDFLDQFIGHILEQSFELREIPDDYLTTPIKLARIKNAPLTSKNIARDLKKLLAIARVLKF